MRVSEQSQWQLLRRQYLGEISALCFLRLPAYLCSLPLLLAGTGSQILVYDLVSGKIIRSFPVFEGIRVHGISVEHFHKPLPGSALAFRIAVFGERRVKLFSLQIESDSLQKPFLDVRLTLIHSLPKFGHWVLDVCFLKLNGASSSEDVCHLAIGCSDNSIYFWDILRCDIFSEVKCAERCLLYSMRMLGNDIESLRIASGTIFNEIVVWKVDHQNHSTSLRSNAEDHIPLTSNEDLIPGSKYKDALISRLVGHEGSIFRIAWFSNGMKLVSVSDDRSARIWEVQAEKGEDRVNHLAGPVLFGHSARIWDCCIYDSTGADGCICYLQHNMLNLEFIGMKQVKELSAIRSVFTTTDHTDDSAVGNYAVGFASANFIIWNLTTGTKVLDITCGGWRRPHSYYLGDLPEMMNCFSFVKDDVIYIHRHWVPESERQIYPRNLHVQFHGREVHSLCFICGHSLCSSDEDQGLVSGSSWIATGCEDGTVRLTRNHYQIAVAGRGMQMIEFCPSNGMSSVK
ncbi:UNVERIFIED_CONTAM: hypothetical protein Sangu_2823800 [Sesamum angustifolium]|uniref:Uncharacterized protein n=1 Tax=Sesamum angustifolium TaxID=2727405 RepID=A0AAW2ISU7_9LAMI